MTHAAPVAQVGTVSISEEDLKNDIGMVIAGYQNEMSLYEKRRAWVEQRVQKTLFELAAKDAKLSVEKFKQREITAKVVAPTAAEVETITQSMVQQAAQRGQTVTPELLATFKKQATDHLQGQKRAQQETQVIAALRQKYPVNVQLPAPVAPNVSIPIGPNDTVKGPANARVTIFEFTDIECPYCKKAQGTLDQILAAYPNDVKLVSRDFPLPMHKRAIPAAEAVLCAKDQGKYWEYRSKTFASPDLQDVDLIRIAKELSLNEKKFKSCLQSNQKIPQIMASMEEARGLGVQSTPHFFVNLREVRGAQPFESFKAAIDQELNKK